MAHRLDIGDVLDMIEESQLCRRPMIVRVRGGHEFEDRVTDIGKYEGEDHVAFADHEMIPVRRISNIRRAYPIEFSYAGKH